MYLVNLFPYFAKNNPVLYSWIGSIAARNIGVDNIVLLGSSLSLLPPSEQIHDPWIADEVRKLTDDEWLRIRKICIPDALTSDWYDLSGDGLTFYRNICTEINHKIEQFLISALLPYINDDIKVGISCANDKTFDSACKKTGINTVYLEGGPIRSPDFSFGTYYYDELGVNGNNSFNLIYEKSKLELNDKDFVSIEQIKKMLYPNENFLFQAPPKYEIGVALQVEDDSNLICYSNNWDSLRLLYKALWVFPSNLVLAREHPKSFFSLKNTHYCDIDYSKNSFEFVKQCKRLLTINSSVAFEAILLGKETYILGKSPLSMAAQNDLTRNLTIVPLKVDLKVFINIFIFCYLIPEWFFLNKEYFDWRSTNPPLKEIFLKNLNSYRDRKYLKQ